MNIGFLLAAGESKRFEGDKLFENIGGKPVFTHSLLLLESSPHVDAIFVAVSRHNKKKIETLVRSANAKKVKKIVIGGRTRFESVSRLFAAANALGKNDFLIIHNAANPLATQEELASCMRVCKGKVSGAAPARRIFGTLKKARPLKRSIKVTRTLARDDVWEAETPQVVRAKDFAAACRKISMRGSQYTDDLSMLEAAGFKTSLVPADPRNRKITMQEDLALLRAFAPPAVSVGFGEDSHRFRGKLKVRNSLVLGGVAVKNLPALEAESDGDVILHALCNALSSALGKGSLGTYATQMNKKGILNSQKYLDVALRNMRRVHRRINNISISIEAKRPLIDPLTPVIKKNLSRLLGISEQDIGITATSGEKLTPFGRGEAIKCQAMVLLRSAR